MTFGSSHPNTKRMANVAEASLWSRIQTVLEQALHNPKKAFKSFVRGDKCFYLSAWKVSASPHPLYKSQCVVQNVKACEEERGFPHPIESSLEHTLTHTHTYLKKIYIWYMYVTYTHIWTTFFIHLKNSVNICLVNKFKC